MIGKAILAVALAMETLVLASVGHAAQGPKRDLMKSPIVKAADARLNQAWKALLAQSSPEEIALLRSMQRDWLKSFPPDTPDPKDLAGYYDERTTYLKSVTGRKDMPALRREEAVFGRYGRQVENCWIEGRGMKCGGMVDSPAFLLPTGVPGEARLIIDTLHFNGHTCTLNEVGKFDISRGVLKVELETMGDKTYIQDVVVGAGVMKIERPKEDVGTPGYCGARGSIFEEYPRWRVSRGR